jgi:hypothetical protein
VEIDGGQRGGKKQKALRAKDARRVSENLLGNSKSSLAVFYVEQVALNRHVSVDRHRPTRRRIAATFFMLEKRRLVK